MYKIAIIESIHQEGIKLLKENSNFKYEIIENTSEKNLINKLPEFDGCSLRISNLTSNILKHCSKLKVISRHGVGYNNVDLNYIKNNNITLMITNNANHISVAEHVMYMMLTISKGIMSHDHSVRTGLFNKGIENIETFELQKKEVLIVGFGRTGKALIRLCKSLYMNVNVYDPYVDGKIISSHGGRKVDDLNENIKTADYLSLHVPLTKETKNMINIDNIKKMKPTSIIINTSRGGIVNEDDLFSALKSGHLSSAAIDVFEEEPYSGNLLDLDNCITTPHMAPMSKASRISMEIDAVKEVVRFANGESLINQVPEFEYQSRVK